MSQDRTVTADLLTHEKVLRVLAGAIREKLKHMGLRVVVSTPQKKVTTTPG